MVRLQVEAQWTRAGVSSGATCEKDSIRTAATRIPERLIENASFAIKFS